jgi:hypothetical protein
MQSDVLISRDLSQRLPRVGVGGSVLGFNWVLENVHRRGTARRRHNLGRRRCKGRSAAVVR